MRIIITLMLFSLFATGFHSGISREGKTLYEHHCARCHGVEGNRGMFGAKDLQKSQLPDSAIALQIRNGKKIMPAFKKKLSTDQINELSTYIKTFRNS